MNIPLPRISVVIPTYNMGRFLPDCLKTIQKQNYPNVEVIIVDGQSTDGTLQILEDFSHMITKVSIQRDTGQPEAVTRGLWLATGDIVHWHAADDIVLPGAFLRVAGELSRNPNVDLVFSDGVAFTTSKVTRGPTVRWVNFLDSLLYFGRFQSDCAYWRRSIMRETLPVDSSKPLTCDEDFFLRMWVGHRYSWINQPLGAFRCHGDQVSRRLDRDTAIHERRATRLQIIKSLGWSETYVKKMRKKRALSYWCLNRFAVECYSAIRYTFRKVSGDFLRKRYTRFLLGEWL